MGRLIVHGRSEFEAEVPYAVFESAWADSGYTMIVTNYVAPDSAAMNASFGGDADDSSPVIDRSAAIDGDTFELDLFSPIRQDWLDHTDTYFHSVVKK